MLDIRDTTLLYLFVEKVIPNIILLYYAPGILLVNLAREMMSTIENIENIFRFCQMTSDMEDRVPVNGELVLKTYKKIVSRKSYSRNVSWNMRNLNEVCERLRK